MPLQRCAPVILFCFLCCLVLWVSALASPAPYLYSDGDTATWIWLLRHGAAIYGPPDGLPMLRTNYPPLFLHLVARLAPSDGAIFRTGSALALGGFALAMGMVGLSATWASGSRRAGLLAALLLGGTFQAAYHAPTCLPDALALGLATSGVTLAARRTPGWPLLAAAAFCLSVLVKHSLVVFPAGVCAWALLREPRRGLLLGAGTAALIGLALFCGGLFAPLFLWTVAPFRLASLLQNVAMWVLLPLGFALALVLRLLRRWGELPAPAQRTLGPWLGSLAVALVWILAMGRVGGGANYTLELVSALAVLTTVAAARGLGGRLFPLHIAVTALFALGGTVHYAGRVLPAMRREMAFTRTALADAPGGVLAEVAWYTTAAGRPPLVIPFLATQLGATGRWDLAPLEASLRAGAVSRLVLGFPLEGRPAGGHADRLHPRLLAAARGRYRLIGHEESVYIYAPAGAAASPR